MTGKVTFYNYATLHKQ